MTIKQLVDSGKIPAVLTLPETVKRLCVHDGQFHADDVMCVALVKECWDENIIVEHINRNTNIEKYGIDTIVCDVGMEYDGQYKFDHHQINSKYLAAKELRAAVGLLWDSYGNQIYHKTTSLIHDIDKHDCESKKFRSQLCVCIGSFNPDWNAKPDERIRCFDMAVTMARQILRATVVSDTYNMRAIREISENSEIKKGVMFIKTMAPFEHIISTYNDVKMVARKVGKDRYSLKAVNGCQFKYSWSGNPPFPNMTMKNWLIETNLENTMKIADLI